MAFLAGWIAWAAWLFLDRIDNKSLQDLKYGSIPATIIAIVWGVLSQGASFFKSVSTRMREYFEVRDYSKQLSYQEQVISDIKFLKEEIGKPPLPVFSLIAGEKCKNWFGLWKDNIKGTSIPNYGSAPEHKLQIIAFVDDLDHCENNAVLKVLWSINLIFRECDINFVLAVDKNTIQTAFRNSPESPGDDSADDFISKIIQLPVNLPDPADDKWKVFLQEGLGVELDTEKDEIKICNDVENHISQSAIDKGRNVSGYEGCIPCLYGQLVPPNGKSQDIETGSSQSEKGKSQDIEAGSSQSENEIECSYSRGDLEKSKELSTRMLEVRGSLILSYSKDEIQTFDRLRNFAAGRQKFPREWKCFIKYHKFAKNVILKKARKLNIFLPSAWQAQLVAWTFVCQRWKLELNILIKQWHKLVEKTPARNKESSPYVTSLKEVVAKYKAQRWPEDDENNWINLTEALNKIQVIAKNWAHEFEIKCRRMEEEIEFKYKSSQGKIDAQEEERERWDDLYKCLDEVQDVTLKNLQIFQEFRFHCDAKYLKIPFA